MGKHLKISVLLLCTFGLLILGFSKLSAQDSNGNWISLFNGENLEGWKASENPKTFSVEEGKIVAHGPRAHLFYQGPVSNHDFQNFEFKADIMTTKGSNSGIYFHTAYQETGWPSKGYEAQVNNTYESDPRKTASLYGYDDINKAPVPDNEWFTMYIKVQGKKVTIKVNDETMVEYTEPENVDREGAVLSSGTFALQGHDPESRVYYKNIKVKPL